jgi:hypothetical protein
MSKSDNDGGDFGFQSALVVFLCVAGCILLALIGGVWALAWEVW